MPVPDMALNPKLNQDIRILLVEDDADFSAQVSKLLGVYNEIFEAPSMAKAREFLSEGSFDVVLLDKKLPDGNGLDLIPAIKVKNPQAVVIVLTGDSNFNLVQKCIEAGASDYLYKSENVVPDLLVRIPMAMSRALLERQSANLAIRFKEAFRYEIVGRSPEMEDLRSTVQSMKGSLSPVLITGESGTGKELVARRLNAIEDQPARPFIAINCGAIPENLVESELFGHARGAFSGAVHDQVGKFELANGGDIFLDEVGELPLPIQVKLLRVLQEGEFTPIGSKRVVKVQIRVIAATNQPLEQMVQEKKFREDLYYRLNVFRINTVPLRERGMDIPDLAQFFLTQISGPKYSWSSEALRVLEAQLWPGNIRELRNAIERAILSAKRRGTSKIEKADVIQRGPSLGLVLGSSGMPKAVEELSNESYQDFMQAAEREYLKVALGLCRYNASEAAQRLGIGRTTLFRRANELGIVRPSKELGIGLRTSILPEFGKGEANEA